MPNNLGYIDELMVLIGADASKLLSDTDTSVKQVESKYKKMADTVDKTIKTGVNDSLDSSNKKIKESGSFVSKLGDTIKNKIGPAKDYFRQLAFSGTGAIDTLRNFAAGRVSISTVVTELGSLAKAFGPVGVAASIGLGLVLNTLKNVGEALNEVWAMMSPKTLDSFGTATASQFEQFETQFTVFLGNAEKAKARIAEYAEFGAKTPFNLPEIVQAGKLLQQFGGDALATGDNLQMVGDMASAVDKPFSEIGMWVARAYSAIQSGRPFGEAAARLQELGLLSGEARNELEQLQKAGASSEEQWSRFTEVMSQYEGMMDKQSQTFKGITSNIEDYQEQIALVGGTPIFDAKKSGLQKQLDFLEENKQSMKGMAQSIGGIKAAFIKLGDSFKQRILEGIDWSQLEKLGQTIWEIVDLMSATKLSDSLSLPELIVKDINGIANGILFIAEKGADVARTWAQIGAFFNAGKTGVYELGKAIVDVFKLLGDFNIWDLITGKVDFKDLGDQIGQKLSEGLKNAEEGAAEAFLATATAIKESDEARKSYISTLQEQKVATEELAAVEDDTDIQKVTESIQKYSEDLLNIQLEHDKQAEQLSSNFQKQMATIQQEANEELFQIREDNATQLNELALEAEQSRYDIYQANQDRLSELESDYREEQKEEEKQHQKDMAKLKNDYLYNLEDAVKNRDAQAIINLRRQYSKEKSESVTNYQEQQNKNKQNLDKQKQDAIKSYQEQMVALDNSLAEKQAKIEQDSLNRMEALAQNVEAQRQAAQADYSAQQELLEQSLNRQLESTMLALERENDITEDQAKQILQTLSDVFGIDGDIDKLMTEFSKRQQLRMEVKVKIDKATEALTGGGSTSTGMGRTTHPGSMSGIPEFATGGLMLAKSPTLVQIAENGPELFSASPVKDLGKLSGMNTAQNQQIELKFSGSAPPGIGVSERDQIAKVLVSIIDQSGVGQMIRMKK